MESRPQKILSLWDNRKLMMFLKYFLNIQIDKIFQEKSFVVRLILKNGKKSYKKLRIKIINNIQKLKKEYHYKIDSAKRIRKTKNNLLKPKDKKTYKY